MREDYYRIRVIHAIKELRGNMKRIAKETIAEAKEEEDLEEKYIEACKQLIIYKTLAAFREDEHDTEHKIAVLLTVVILIETIVIWLLI